MKSASPVMLGQLVLRIFSLKIHAPSADSLVPMNTTTLLPDLTPYDYTLAPNADCVWIHIGTVSVLIRTDDNTVVVSAYKQGADDEAGCLSVSL